MLIVVNLCPTEGDLKKQSQFIRIAYCVMRIAKRNLKKQSQFAKGKNDVKPLLIMIYADFGVLRRRKNKPNSKPNKANRRPSAGNPKQVE
jgi:hypothetical protein